MICNSCLLNSHYKGVGIFCKVKDYSPQRRQERKEKKEKFSHRLSQINTEVRSKKKKRSGFHTKTQRAQRKTENIEKTERLGHRLSLINAEVKGK